MDRPVEAEPVLRGVLSGLPRDAEALPQAAWLLSQAMSMQCRDAFSRLLAGSIALTFFVYAFVNAGMVMGLLPVVGVPLPLVSYGGTSFVTLMAGFGILMSLHSSRKLVG